MKTIRIVEGAEMKVEGDEVVVTGTVENSNDTVKVHMSLAVLEAFKGDEKPKKKGEK